MDSNVRQATIHALRAAARELSGVDEKARAEAEEKAAERNKKTRRNKRIGPVRLNDIKQALKDLGLDPPNMRWLKKRAEVLAWIDRFISDEDFEKLVGKTVNER